MDLYDVCVSDKTQDGKCSNCGQCCSDLLPLSEKEVRAIKKYISEHHIKEQRHNVATGVFIHHVTMEEAIEVWNRRADDDI